MFFIGIDPGFSGAIARLHDNGDVISVVDVPTTQVEFTKGGKKRQRTELLPAAMNLLLYCPALRKFFIEDVTARPGQGVTSMFRFGHGLGLWEGLLTANSYAYEKIRPVVWKAEFGLIGKEKEAALSVAQKLFGSKYLYLKKHHGRADAMLLAEYGRREYMRSINAYVPETNRKRTRQGKDKTS
jgi:crossover junction endodeoxyribonuclease RuvC